jgi:hypothetical protein
MATENIHTQYDWTSIPRNSPYRNVAPYVKLTSYKITSSAALNRITSYLSLVNGSSADEFYEKLYRSPMNLVILFKMELWGILIVYYKLERMRY